MEEVKEALLQEIKIELNLDKDITWSNYGQKVFLHEIKNKLNKIENEFNNYLEIFKKLGFIKIIDGEINCQIQFDELIEKILSRDHEITKTYDEIYTIFKIQPEDFINFLQYSGLVFKEGNIIKSNLTTVRDILLDDVLTFIEQKDAIQIRYGI
ncbi:MAG: hypothetical protein QXO27_04580 [Candidatus Aenigmatarchaeota archaeon]